MAKARAEIRRDSYRRNVDARRAYSREYMRRRRAADPEGEKRKLVEWREANADRVKATNRSRHLRLRYGITVEQFEEMLASQGGKCAICRADEPGGHGRWHVDHCHKGGRVRGILCSNCNRALGFFCDDVDVVLRAAEYLQEAA